MARMQLPLAYIQPLYDLNEFTYERDPVTNEFERKDNTNRRASFRAHMHFVMQAIRDQREGAEIAGDAHELFDTFHSIRCSGFNRMDRAPHGSAPRIYTNACEGNADVVFYLDDFRVILATMQDDYVEVKPGQYTDVPRALKLIIVHDPKRDWASEDY